MQRLIDLSRPTDSSQRPYPGDPPPDFSPICTLAQNGCRVTQASFSLHQGTHVDAPSHFIDDGLTIDQIPLCTFYGPARLVDLAHDSGQEKLPARSEITVAMLKRHADVFTPGGRVLLRTGWGQISMSTDAANTVDYFNDTPELTLDAALWIAGRGIVLLGIDLASPSRTSSDAVHRVLLGTEPPTVIIENLVLPDDLPPGFTLSALPLRLTSCEASPVRAFAIIG